MCHGVRGVVQPNNDSGSLVYQQFNAKERKMTDNPKSESLGLDVDRHEVDLGDDVDRTAGNQGSTLSDSSSAGLEGGLDPGNTDLGDDVFRNESNQGAVLSDTDGSGLEGGLDPGNTDLGDDVYRDA
jgi:hypothetical protein